MKEFLFATIAVIIIAVAAAYGLDAMNWTAENAHATQNIRL